MKILKTYKEIVNESRVDHLTYDQRVWCKVKFNYDYNVDSSGKIEPSDSSDIRIMGNRFDSFPVSFANIPGTFAITDSDNESLEGSPEEIGGSYSIRNCPRLESLKGISKQIGGNINITDCPNLKSLDGVPLDFPEDKILFFPIEPSNYDELIYNWKNGITLDDQDRFKSDWEI